MSTWVLYGILLFLSLAMLLFVAGYLCVKLGIGLFAALCYSLGGKILLLAFGLLVLLGVAALIVTLKREFCAYFNREAMAKRRILSIQTRNNDLMRRAVFERRQIHYFGLIKRQRLQIVNNRKHLRVLYIDILRELQSRKPGMPASNYVALGKALRKHHKRADAEAMLALRKQIPCR